MIILIITHFQLLILSFPCILLLLPKKFVKRIRKNNPKRKKKVFEKWGKKILSKNEGTN